MSPLLLFALACHPDFPGANPRHTSPFVDRDGDGYPEGWDCDDADAGVNPLAVEFCNGVDEDCSGVADDHSPSDGLDAWPDADGDGWGSNTGAVRGCVLPEGWLYTSGDCDDDDPDVNPGVAEVCDDADVDEDCDGLADDDDAYAEGTRQVWRDDDGDGQGDGGERSRVACPAAGWVENGDDCDDLDPTVRRYTWGQDADGDGWGQGDGTPTCAPPPDWVPQAGDCADDDATVHPGAEESCEGTVDANCDGEVGEGDADGDGVAACQDCDDRDATRRPGAAETCDEVDQDCDGAVDDDPVDGADAYADADHDGYGDPEHPIRVCETATGWSLHATDCDDTNSSVSPGAEESCATTTDDNCDGTYSEVGASQCQDQYVDEDRDGYGSSTRECVCPDAVGYAGASGDCDDLDAETHPRAPEDTATYADEDCDGWWGPGPEAWDVVMEGTEPDEDRAVQFTWELDLDGDGRDDLVARSVAPEGAVELRWYPGPTPVADDGSAALVSPARGFGSVLLGVDLDGAGALLVLDPTVERADGTRGAVYRFDDTRAFGRTVADAHATWYGGPGFRTDPQAMTWAPSLSSVPVVVLAGEDDSVYLLDVAGEGRREVADALTGGVLATSDGGFESPTPGHDLDGDGQEDLLLLFETSDRESQVAAALGPVAELRTVTELEVSGDSHCHGPGLRRVGALGDLGGDGLDDVWAVPVEGAGVEVYDSFASLAACDGPGASLWDGTQVGYDGSERLSAPDLDADGEPDLLLAAPASSAPGFDAGVVSIWWGPTRGVTSDDPPDAAWAGEIPSARFGSWSSLGPDLDADGLPDVYTSARQEPTAPSNAGLLYHLGSSALHTCHPDGRDRGDPACSDPELERTRRTPHLP